MRTTRPSRYSRVNAVPVRSTRIRQSWDWKRSDRLRSRTPGRSPASQSTWKPLQMPKTSPPSRAKAMIASMIGLNRAMAPGRR